MARLFTFVQRPPTPLATVVTALGVGVLSVCGPLFTSAARLSAPRVLLLAGAFGLGCTALVLAGSGIVWGSGARFFAHLRTGLIAALVLSWSAVDSIYFSLFRRHLDSAALQVGWEAVRSKTLRFGPADMAALLGSVLVAALLVTSVHAALSRLACTPLWTERLRRITALLLVLGIAAALLRDKLCDERHPEALRLQTLLPWTANTAPALAEVAASASFATDQDGRTLAELGQARRDLMHAELRARLRPNLLVVHVESLRADVFTPALMPKLSALGNECWVARRHYSTGNATGQSVFGLVTGLGGFLYAGARAQAGPALPLVALQRLGYSSFAHFANNLAEYDAIFDVLFRGAVTQSYTAPEGTSDRMDVAVVDHYLASLSAPAEPRFDYLVLDSTHYDYAYPPEYERHTPSGTLDLGARDAIFVEVGINDRLRPRAPLVKNRYLNAVEWVDSLLGRLIEGMRAKNRWTSTWVAIVGDHGEAFWEHGTFGHGAGLEDEQVRVPLVLCGSPRPSAHYEYTSHADLFPTWFDLMGVTFVPRPFMTGHSLAAYRPELDLAISGIGVTGTFTSRRLMVAGRGLKVTFDNAPGWPIASVSDRDDRPLSARPPAVYTLLAQALGTRLLHSPAGE